MKFTNFFLFLWVIIYLQDPDPDPGTPVNPDRIQIRIHNTSLKTDLCRNWKESLTANCHLLKKYNRPQQAGWREVAPFFVHREMKLFWPESWTTAIALRSLFSAWREKIELGLSCDGSLFKKNEIRNQIFTQRSRSTINWPPGSRSGYGLLLLYWRYEEI